MVVMDNSNVVFIHIPKTAGTSIQYLLRQFQSNIHKYCLANTKHETVQSLVGRVGIEVFNNYFSFSVVRHPLDRFVSHYRYLKSNPDNFLEMIEINSLEKYVDVIELNNLDVIRKKERVLPQNEYLKINNIIVVNEILRFENLNNDIFKLFNKLQIDFSGLPKINESKWDKPSVSSYVQSFVNRYYSDDFDLLGY